jgi:hypothetical protein
MARADASRLRRKLSRLRDTVAAINDEQMFDAADEFIDNVNSELASTDTDNQVGFNPDQFISNLRQTLSRAPDGAWEVNPLEAGGDEGDFEEIGGQYKRGDHLWHGGTGNTAAFFRRVMSDAQEQAGLARRRQNVWGDKTPQWYLLNYGSPEAGQPPTNFLENAVDNTNLEGTRARIQAGLEEDWYG